MTSPVSLAPMIRRTDRHFRYLMRLLSPSLVLYTEMITSAAIRHGDASSLLHYHLTEHPVVLQLAGNDPVELAVAAKQAERCGYDAINFNVGCPSDRVQSGRFGVCLMKTPDVVARCMQAMQEAVSIPVSIKTRIGVDEYDSPDFFFNFIKVLYDVGCRHFIVHARKAWLHGLSPKENRTVPPLHYERVYQLKKNHPDCQVVVNGGIQDSLSIATHLQHVDGVMLGRLLYQNPFAIVDIDRSLGLPSHHMSRADIVTHYLDYMCDQMSQGARIQSFIPHLLGLYYQQPGGKRWRQCLTVDGARMGAGVEVIQQALSLTGA